MATYFGEYRNIELSTLAHFETQLGSDWSNVSVEKTWKRVYSADVSLPIVCIRLGSSEIARLEIGSTTLEPRHMIIIDIFATSDAQRLDLANYVTTKLKDGWVYNAYAHVSGDKSQLTETADGRIFVTTWITNDKVDFGDTTEVKDRYRHTISIAVRKST